MLIKKKNECIFYIFLQIEMGILQKAYASLVKQMSIIFNQKLWYIMLEQFLMKYVWSGAGMVMVSVSLLTARKDSKSPLVFIVILLSNTIYIIQNAMQLIKLYITNFYTLVLFFWLHACNKNNLGL